MSQEKMPTEFQPLPAKNEKAENRRKIEDQAVVLAHVWFARGRCSDVLSPVLWKGSGQFL